MTADPSPGTERRAVRTGLALGLLGVAAFSLTLPMARVALGEIDAASVAVWRGLVASFAAAAVLLALRPPRPRGRQWLVLAACAFGTVFGFPVFTTLAMRSVSASHGAVVVGLLPLATAVVGALVAGERPSTAFWLTSLLGTALTVAFVLRQATGGLAVGHVHLGIAVVTAAIGYASGARLTRALPGWSVACWALVLASPVLAVAGLLVPPPSLAVGAEAFAAFLYLALVSQLGGFFVWYRGLALGGIARVSQVQLLQLFMTLGVAMLALGEPFDPEVLAFGGAVVASVAVGTRLRVSRRASVR